FYLPICSELLTGVLARIPRPTWRNADLTGLAAASRIATISLAHSTARLVTPTPTGERDHFQRLFRAASSAFLKVSLDLSHLVCDMSEAQDGLARCSG